MWKQVLHLSLAKHGNGTCMRVLSWVIRNSKLANPWLLPIVQPNLSCKINSNCPNKNRLLFSLLVCNSSYLLLIFKQLASLQNRANSILSVCISGRNRNSCKVTRRPWLKTKGRDRSRISDIIIDVVKKMMTPVTVLHVTPMGAFRSDAHVGTWSDNPSVPDCSHWCLPGVPDTWNEILLSMMLSKDGQTVQWLRTRNPFASLTFPASITLPCR